MAGGEGFELGPIGLRHGHIFQPLGGNNSIGEIIQGRPGCEGNDSAGTGAAQNVDDAALLVEDCQQGLAGKDIGIDFGGGITRIIGAGNDEGVSIRKAAEGLEIREALGLLGDHVRNATILC